MADLQKLKEIVEQIESLESEVTALTKQRDGLRQDNITLEAKNKHLSDRVKVFQESIEIANVETSRIEADQKASREKHEGRIAELMTQLRVLDFDFKKKNSELENARTNIESDIVRLSDNAAELSNEVSLLENQKASLESEVAALDNELAVKRGEVTDANSKLLQLEDDTATARSKHDIALKEQAAELNRRRAMTADAESDLTLAKDALADAEEKTQAALKKHTNFTEYESRAVKALEARERALLEKERQLGIEATQARRRGSILANLD